MTNETSTPEHHANEQKPPQKQHFVPQLYLKGWYDPEAKTLAIAKDGKVKGGRKAGQHAYLLNFYQYTDLTPDELSCLVDNVSRSFPGEYELVRFLFIRIYLNVLGYRCIEPNGYRSYETVFNRIECRWPLTWAENLWKQKLLNHIRGVRSCTENEREHIVRTRNLGFERYESRIENNVKDMLDNLRNKGGLSFMKDKTSAFRFVHYIMNQGTRGPDYLKFLETTLPRQSLPIGTTVNVGRYIRYFLPLCAAHLLTQPKEMSTHRMARVINESGHEFITGDVPLIPIGKEQGLMQGSLDYIPISPRIGIVYGLKKTVEEFKRTAKITDSLKDASIAKRLNKAIVSSCCDTVFARSADFLEKHGYIPENKHRHM